MQWINQFDLFLFDFDGLLVDTEKFHYEAYCILCHTQGVELDWDFEQFCNIAHSSATAIRDALHPRLIHMQPKWDVLYSEKKKIYLNLLSSKPLELMPGAFELLSALAKTNIRRVVATHSPREQINLIKSHLPILNTIPFWVTREDYTNPKPAPDAYLTAIALHGQPQDRIIGFEDSLRGLTALMATPALALHITTRPGTHPYTFPTINAIQLPQD